MSSKLIVPVALGLSLVTVTAVVVYYIFKKDEEEDGGKVKTSRVNVIEVSVPKSIVPALIGRSGSNIKDIEKKSGAMIHFKKFSDKDYDVCIIRGRSDAAQLAETLVHDFVKEQPKIEDDNMMVPGWACGRIIGQNGDNINEISHRSGARIKVESGGPRDSATQRTVFFKGTTEQINQAKKLIEACVAQEKCRREIDQSKRSPRVATSSSTSHSEPTDTTDTSDMTLPGDTRVKRTKNENGCGASIEVYVSAVSSPARFWVQLVGPQVSQLDDLVANMTDYYGRQENRDNHKLKSVSVGQVVAAVFRHDGRWYRARVHDIRPNEFDSTQQVADVFYLDYGDSEYVATHELCELRADLLRLRFQAMECFLAGVRPAGTEEQTVAVTAGGTRWDKWHPQAIERFEELTQVARWKALVSRTCTLKKASGDGDKDKEIPGIKLYDVTDEGMLDIGATLVAEGWAVEVPSPRTTPPPATPTPTPAPATPTPATPFGDLGNSIVLGMLSGGGGSPRASSVPKDHRDEPTPHDTRFPTHTDKENERMTASKSLGFGLDKSDNPNPTSVPNLDIAYPTGTTDNKHQNGSLALLESERNTEKTDSNDTLTPYARVQNEELKANMNRIDSHHNNLEALGRSQTDLHRH